MFIRKCKTIIGTHKKIQGAGAPPPPPLYLLLIPMIFLHSPAAYKDLWETCSDLSLWCICNSRLFQGMLQQDSQQKVASSKIQ